MRFFSIIAAAASLLAPIVSAQSNAPLAITAPLGGSFQAGSQLTITWTPTTASSVTLILRYGSNSDNLATGAPIACKFLQISRLSLNSSETNSIGSRTVSVLMKPRD
jgi:hypothetical protein